MPINEDMTIHDSPARSPWPDPTPEQIKSDIFNRIWECIRTWDINVPEQYNGYSQATGNHVVAILNAIEPVGDDELVAAIKLAMNEIWWLAIQRKHDWKDVVWRANSSVGRAYDACAQALRSRGILPGVEP